MLTLFLASVALAAAPQVNGQEVNRPDLQEIAQGLAQAAATTPLPQQIDPTTKMVDVRASGLTLNYFYETSEDATEAGFRRFFARNNIARMCADEDVRWAFRQGVVFRFNYVITVNDTEPFVIQVGAADCGD